MAQRRIFYCDLCNKETANYLSTGAADPASTGLYEMTFKFKPQHSTYSTVNSWNVCADCSHDFEQVAAAWVMKRRLLKSGA